MMRGVSYSSWAEYILALFDIVNPERSRVLEIASGTSAVSKYLKDKFELYIISDQSKEMLKVNERKDAFPVCFDMRSIPLKGKFDFIFSIFDSINYLMTTKDLSTFFNECKNLLSEDGVLTFDVSLRKNSLKNLKLLNRHGKINGVKYKQTSKYDPDKAIHMNIFEIEYNNRIYKEVHKQRIYEFETFFVVIYDNGLVVADCFNCFTFDDANPGAECVQFVVRK